MFGMPRRIVERGETAAGDAEQMEFFELEMIDQSVEIGGDAAGLRPGRIGRAPAPPAPVKGDDAIAGFRERCDLRRPDVAVAGVGMQQHDGGARAAGVGDVELHTGKVDIHTLEGLLGADGRDEYK